MYGKNASKDLCFAPEITEKAEDHTLCSGLHEIHNWPQKMKNLATRRKNRHFIAATEI